MINDFDCFCCELIDYFNWFVDCGCKVSFWWCDDDVIELMLVLDCLLDLVNWYDVDIVLVVILKIVIEVFVEWFFGELYVLVL